MDIRMVVVVVIPVGIVQGIDLEVVDPGVQSPEEDRAGIRSSLSLVGGDRALILLLVRIMVDVVPPLALEGMGIPGVEATLNLSGGIVLVLVLALVLVLDANTMLPIGNRGNRNRVCVMWMNPFFVNFYGKRSKNRNWNRKCKTRKRVRMQMERMAPCHLIHPLVL